MTHIPHGEDGGGGGIGGGKRHVCISQTERLKGDRFIYCLDPDDSVFFSNNSNMSTFVLVTGATGFIGAHIVDVLLARGIECGARRVLSKKRTP